MDITNAKRVVEMEYAKTEKNEIFESKFQYDRIGQAILFKTL